MIKNVLKSFSALCLSATVYAQSADYEVTFKSLLNEMADRSAVSQWPEHEYKQILHSSYNRASKGPDQPGWYANGDTGHFIRREDNAGRKEFVLMEHDGPGVITRFWSPAWHGGVRNTVGNTIRYYFDGSKEPAIETNLIQLLTGKGPVKVPFAQPTARAGDLYLPIPFAKSCKITMQNSVGFYNISFRSYLDKDLKVETFKQSMLETHAATMEKVGKELVKPSAPEAKDSKKLAQKIAAGENKELQLANGSNEIKQLTFKVDAKDHGQALRSTVLEIKFDGTTTVWTPIGDFFATVRTVEPYNTWERDVLEDGTMICRWQMPYERSATIKLHNLGKQDVSVKAVAETSPIKWNNRMMHFHAAWTTVGPLAPNPKLDMNYVEVKGKGIHVGDSITVVNPHWAWWGEGDEKIWVDDDFAKNFPSQIGTGTEDYYGWAGGVHPTRADEFTSPFLANVRVGGEDSGKPEPGGLIHTRGYNTCTRSRSLDANMFKERFLFNVEHWQWHQGKTDWLHYSKTAHWYAIPGSTHNRKPMPEEVAKTLVTPEWVETYALEQAKEDVYKIENALDVQKILSKKMPVSVKTHVQKIRQPHGMKRFNEDTMVFYQSAKVGDSFEYTITEQYVDRDITVYLGQATDFGKLDIYVNNKLVKKGWDGYANRVTAAKPVKLGKHKPDGNFIRVKFVVTGKNEKSKNTFVGVDCVVVK